LGSCNTCIASKAPSTPHLGISDPTSFVLAVINKCDSPTQHPTGLDIYLYSRLRGLDIVDIATVQSLVGRVSSNNRWALFDRRGDLARTTFADGEAGEGAD
jgi:hypothetical protein